ncbi:hypothetical protein ACS0TY_000383 [Phlomoides rotata]
MVVWTTSCRSDTVVINYRIHPCLSDMLESLTNPTNKAQLEERMSHIKDDPYLKTYFGRD